VKRLRIVIPIAALLTAHAAPVLAQGNSTPGAAQPEGGQGAGKVEVGVGTTDEVTTGNSGPDEPGTRAATTPPAGGQQAGSAEAPSTPTPAAPGCDALADPAARERCLAGG
jgi:hypothetical protein